MAMQRRVRWLALGCALVLATGAPALSEPRTIQVVEGDTLEQLEVVDTDQQNPTIPAP